MALASVCVASPSWAQSSSAGVEEIVVTAEKRSENLQVVPIADTALTGEDLVTKNIVNLQDLTFYVPGLQEYEAGPGRVDYTIRGIGGEGQPSANADGGVGTYQDEVYIGRPYLVNTEFLDIDRVEVLRGPQGTLFGRNTIGGAISFYSREPDDETTGAADLTGGNYGTVDASGYVSGKLTDGLDGLMAVNVKSHGGYDTNTSTGDKLDDETFYGVSGALRWRPTADLDMTLNVDTGHRTGNGGWWVLTNTDACPGSQSNYYAYTPCSISGMNQPGQISPNPRKQQEGADNGLGDIDNTGGSLNIKWTNPWGLLTSISSYRTGRLNTRTDEVGPQAEPLNYCNSADFANFYSAPPYNGTHSTGAPINGVNCPGWTGGNGATSKPYPSYPSYVGYDSQIANYNKTFDIWPLSDMDYTLFEKDKTEQYSQELRLSSVGDSPLSWIVGAYFYREATDQINGYNYQFNFPESSAYAYGGTGYTDGHVTTDSYALFAHVGYNFTDALKVQAGVRWTEDHKTTAETPYGTSANAQYTYNGTDTPNPNGYTPCPANGCWYATGQKTFVDITPGGTISYQVDPDIFTYATVSQGFKSGGFNDQATDNIAATVPFKTETLTNYEVGAKTEWLDRRLLLNASVFYLKYSNFQAQEELPCSACGKGEEYFVSNLGVAHNQGIELEFEYRPIDALDLYGNYSYQDGKIDKASYPNGEPAPFGPLTNLAGDRLEFAPGNKFTVGSAYTMLVDTINVTPRIQYSFTEHQWSEVTNIPAEIAPSMSSLDASLLFAPEAWSQWSLEFWGKNLENHLNYSDSFVIWNSQFRKLGAPETFGVTLHFRP